MKKTNLFLMFLACTLAIFSFIGCSSTPEVAPVEETPGETVVVDVPTSDELKSILEAVTQAKEAAKEAGADVAYPSEFDKAATTLEELVALYNSGTTEDLNAKLDVVKNDFLVLEKLTLAEVLKTRIVDENLQGVDPDSFNKGETELGNAKSLYAEGASSAEVLPVATSAYDAFFTVLNKGYKDRAFDAKDRTTAAKQKADSIKCAVAEKAAYQEVDLIFMSGETSFGNGFYEEAFQRYEKSAVGFTDLYETVSVKRTAAQAALDSAQKKIDSAAAIAAEADEKAPLQDEGENQE